MPTVPEDTKATVSDPGMVDSSPTQVSSSVPGGRGGAVRDWLDRAGYVLRGDRGVQIALVVGSCIFITAALGPLLFAEMASGGALQNRLLPPLSFEHGWEYVLGADGVGRSFLARLVVASRTTLVIAVLATVVSAIIGSGIGIAVGYVGGKVDAFAMRVADMLLAFPVLLLALVVLYTFPGGIMTIVFVLAFARLAVFMRVARGEVLAVREQVFVKAARALGASATRIVLRQIAPIVLPTIGAIAIIEFARIMLAEATLSFLGIGVQPPDVTWGILISNGRNYLAQAWWVAVIPGIAITGTTVSLHILGDWLRRVQEVSG